MSNIIPNIYYIVNIKYRNHLVVDNQKETTHISKLDLERLIHKDLQVHSKQKLFLTAVAACDL